MSQENVELVRRALRSVETFWGLLDEHVVWDLRERGLTKIKPVDLDEVYVGRDAVIKASRHYWGTWDEYQLDEKELIDAGSSVVVVFRERGRGKVSGAPIERTAAQVWSFSRGRIVRWEEFPDRDAALEAAGLSEQDTHADP